MVAEDYQQCVRASKAHQIGHQAVKPVVAPADLGSPVPGPVGIVGRMQGVVVSPEEMLKGIGRHEMDDRQSPVLSAPYQMPSGGGLSVPEGVGVLKVGVSLNQALAQSQLVTGEAGGGKRAEVGCQRGTQSRWLRQGV